LMHWMITPFVTAYWTKKAFYASIFTFIQVFVMATLHMLSWKNLLQYDVD